MQNKNHVFELLLVSIIYRILKSKGLGGNKKNNAKTYKILSLIIMRLLEYLLLFIPRFSYSFTNMCYVKLVNSSGSFQIKSTNKKICLDFFNLNFYYFLFTHYTYQKYKKLKFTDFLDC